MKKINVLFLCSGNTARSQMAEAFLRKYGSDRFEAYSAGLHPSTIHPMTEQVMEERGFDLSDQYSKDLEDYMGKKHFGYLITVCDRAKQECPSVFPGMGQRLHWSIDDPVAFQGTEAAQLEKFRDVRDEIERRITDWIAGQKSAT